jgi:GcrA cell cycle regulator
MDLIAAVRSIMADRRITAAKAGEQLGMTRCAVIGVCYRNGIEMRGKTTDEANREKRARKVPPVIRGALAGGRGRARLNGNAPMLTAPVHGGGKELAKLGPKDCRYPIGDPGATDFKFCGALAKPNLPYCAHHCAKCYRPAVVKEISRCGNSPIPFQANRE